MVHQKKIFTYKNRDFLLYYDGSRLTLDGISTPVYIYATPTSWTSSFLDDVFVKSGTLTYKSVLEISCEYLLALELELAKKNRFLDGLKDA